VTEPLSAADLDALRRYDTPTICNGLELVAPERRATGFTVEPLVASNPALPPMVGYARTATIRALDRPGAQAKATRLAYYEHVASGPGPRIVVIQDVDPRPGFGAFWGEVQSNVHKALGCAGGVTNGTIRDLDMIAEGFLLLGGAVGPSHAWVHVVDFGKPVNVCGMAVSDGDLIHADRHGAVVVPADAVRKLPAAIDLLTRREAVILEACKRPDFGIETLRRAFADQDDIH